MSGNGRRVDIPMFWEDEVLAPVPLAIDAPVGNSEIEELVEGTDSNVVPSDKESADDSTEFSGLIFLNRRGLIAKLIELKREVRRLKNQNKTLKEELKEKKEQTDHSK